MHDLTNGLKAVLNIGNTISFDQFGAKGNGENDDTSVMKKCIAYALDNKKNITCSENKIYLINETLELKNLYVNFKGAKIISNIDCGALLSINTIDNTNFSDYYGVLENVILDCSNVDTGLHIQMGRKKLIRNLICEKIKHYGLRYSTGYEVIVKDCHFSGNSTENSIGIYASGGDSYFMDCVMIDCYNAVVNRGFNFYRGIHAWIRTHSLAPTASMFVCGGNVPCFVEQCYSDTYGRTFNMKDAWVIANQLYIYFNPSIYEETYDAPYLFYTEGDLFTSYYQKRTMLTNSDLRGVSNRDNQHLQYFNQTTKSMKVNYNNVTRVDGYNSPVASNIESLTDKIGNIKTISLYRKTIKNGFVHLNLAFSIDTSISKSFQLGELPYESIPNGEVNHMCCWGNNNVNQVDGVGFLKIYDAYIRGNVNLAPDNAIIYIKINVTYPIVSEFIEY